MNSFLISTSPAQRSFQQSQQQFRCLFQPQQRQLHSTLVCYQRSIAGENWKILSQRCAGCESGSPGWATGRSWTRDTKTAAGPDALDAPVAPPSNDGLRWKCLKLTRANSSNKSFQMSSMQAQDERYPSCCCHPGAVLHFRHKNFTFDFAWAEPASL